MILFEESKYSGYTERTVTNASADATILFSQNFNSSGTILTVKSVIEQNKKLIQIDLNNFKISQDRIDKTVQMLNSVGAKTINIAGNGMYTLSRSKSSLTQKQIDNFVFEFLSQVVVHPQLENKVELIRSGGQTGVDESGAKAGFKLGIKTLVYCPNGWMFVGGNGKTIKNEEKFKERFL
jgi:hypothetical protein